MADHLSIGRFSELTGLTIKALRLYGRLGVLPPAVVDLSSGYRYYTPDQVDIARRVQLLRSLDMPLEEIRGLLNERDPVAARAHLRRHRERLKRRIAGYQQGLTTLQALEKWYEHLGKEGSMEQQSKDYRCSFCGKHHSEISRMIAGPNDVFICNECVDLCNEVIAKARAEQEAARG